MNPQTRIRYHFHAEGHALGGEFRHPSWIPIQAQAATSLPTIGGHSTAHAEDFHVQDFVSFKRAHTHVSGKRRRSDGGDTYVTHATTTIEDLNILGVVTAARIVCRLSSVHSPKSPEGHIIADDSRFEGLRIKGQDVKVTLRHNLLVDCETFDDLVTKGIANDTKKGKIAFIDRKQEVAICSLVEEIETKLKGVDVRRHLIEVPDFGKIFLAEVFTDPGTRTLTMLRLELGSPHVADVTAGETRINGFPYP
jgi:hypothetical protein